MRPCSPGNGEWLKWASRKLFGGLGYGAGVTIVIGDGVCLHSSPPESVSEQLQSGRNT